VEERQAAVAVFFRDRHDEAEVAFRQLALGLLIFRVYDLEHHHAVLEALGSLLRGDQDRAVFADPGLALTGGALRVLMSVDLGPQLVDAAIEIFECADHLLDPLRAEAKLFDEPHRAAAATREASPGSLPLVFACFATQRHDVVATVALEQN